MVSVYYCRSESIIVNVTLVCRLLVACVQMLWMPAPLSHAGVEVNVSVRGLLIAVCVQLAPQGRTALV